MRSLRPIRALLTALVAVAVTLAVGAPPAHATGSISIDEGTSFDRSQTITVRYKGFPLYERFFVQQCWDGPGPEFDFAVSCHSETMIFPGLIDRDEGTVSFNLFVGDDPFGAFPVSCGPRTNPAYTQFDTCYIRAVTYSRESNELAVFVPITFEGARPATTTTTVPVTLAPSDTTAVTSGVTTSAAPVAPPAGATTAVSGPSISAAAQRSSDDGSGRSPLGTAILGVGLAGLALVATRVWTRRRA